MYEDAPTGSVALERADSKLSCLLGPLGAWLFSGIAAETVESTLSDDGCL